MAWTGAQCQVRGFLWDQQAHPRSVLSLLCPEHKIGWGRGVKWDLRFMCREIKAFVLHEGGEVR